MTGPFTDADDASDLFITKWCNRCVHCTDFGEPCDDFLPAWVNEWPKILTPVPLSDSNPVGIECTRFKVDW